MALPLLAITATKSPFLISLIAVASYLPEVAAPLFGPLIDRTQKRFLMVSLDAFRGIMVSLLGLGILVFGAQYWFFLVVSLLFGFAEVVYEPTDEAFVLELSRSEEELVSLNSRSLAATEVGDQFFGRPIAGALVEVSRTIPVFVDGLSYLVSALLIRSIGSSPEGSLADDGDDECESSEEEEEGDVLSYMGEVGRGFRELIQNRPVRQLAMTTGTVNLIQGVPAGIGVLYYTQTVGVSALGFGLLATVGALGVIVGTRLVRMTVGRLRLAQLLWMGLGLMAGGFLGVSLAPNVWVLGVFVWLTGVCRAAYNVSVGSANQLLISRKVFGAVRSSYRLFAVGAVPLGSLLGAGIAEALGLRAPFVAAAVGLGVVSWVVFARGVGEVILSKEA